MPRYRWRATCGAKGWWQEGLAGIDAGLIAHVRRCIRTDQDGEPCDDAGMELKKEKGVPPA